MQGRQVSIAQDLNLPFPLRSYQWDGVTFLYQSQSALLADEMGLGKTVQAAIAIQALVNSKQCGKVLIVSPASLCLNWEWELARWTYKIPARRVRGTSDDRKAHFRLPFKIWIASYEQIRVDVDFLSKEPEYDLVVLDEVQRIKNASTSLALACRQLRRKRSWALSGTPIENRPDDLLSIFSFLKPGLIHSALTLSEIHDRIAPHFLRRTKGEVLPELPPIIFQDVTLELEGEQQDAYNEEWIRGRERLRRRHGRLTMSALLAQITRLKLLCNFEPVSGESVKFNTIYTVLEELKEEQKKVLIFSQYVRTLQRIKQNLKGFPVDIFHGGLSSDEKFRLVNAFQNISGFRVLLVSLKAGGVGLNLGGASVVILFDRWWNPAVEDQAIQRAHRYGRDSPLHVIRFIVSDTIEERIEGILKNKQIIFEKYIEEATTAEIKPFTHDELIQILGLGFKS